MAPRKSRSVYNKRFGKVNEESPDKDGGSGGNQSRQTKRKPADMLGSRWSNEELKRFYEAYRKYGEDWQKVTSAVGNRSTVMVKALYNYNLNKAYLSLPEGMASVAGFTAIMNDEYCMLELDESESDQSNDAPRISQKLAKRAHGKYQVNSSKDLNQLRATAENSNALTEISAQLQTERQKNAELMKRISLLEALLQERVTTEQRVWRQDPRRHVADRSSNEFKRPKMEADMGEATNVDVQQCSEMLTDINNGSTQSGNV